MRPFIHGGKGQEARFVFRVATADVEAVTYVGESTRITDTTTSARVGDLVRFESGTLQYSEYPIISVPDANHFFVGARIAPAVSDTFYILRYITQRTDSSGSQIASFTPSPNSAGNSPGSGTVSTVVTLSAPANAVGFVLMNLEASTTNLRWRAGAIATTTSGQQLQPGRDTGYIPMGANLSIVAESGTVSYDVQWILSA